MKMIYRFLLFVYLGSQLTCGAVFSQDAPALQAALEQKPVSRTSGPYQLATFSADVTIPIGHRCMGIIPTKSKKVVDPLEAIGFVLLSKEKPLVYVAVDWCEIRNGAYDEWREALAEAAETTRERVLVSSLHQHDAPVTDSGAAKLLADVGLQGELYDEAFHQQSVAKVAAALKASLQHAVPVTHIGTGKARVEQVASNRRVVLEDGRITFSRGSRSGADPFYSQAPEGEIDPYLWTLYFWNEKTPVLALHSYATHPMSYYGQGEVTADFVGLARRKMQQEFPQVKQIYASGCSGDVTAGKFNDGSPRSREELTQRIYLAMKKSWNSQVRYELKDVNFRNTKLELPFYEHELLKAEILQTILDDATKRTEDRILAAMGLSSWQRVQRGAAIDFPCIDFGKAQILLFPGESFVGFQLMAQQTCPNSFVMSIGYGECWPGYVPTNAAFADGFQDNWLWVGPGSEQRIRTAIESVLVESEEAVGVQRD